MSPWLMLYSACVGFVSPLNLIYTEAVRIVGSGVRGWLDASHERSNWLKYIRSTATPHLINLRHILIGGEILYETIRDIAIGEELLLGLREPLQLQDILGENATEDRSDRETASQHSGTVDEDREDEEESETRCTVCDKPFQDIDLLDGHLVTCHRYPADQHRCDDCPRGYAWRALLVRHRAIVHGTMPQLPTSAPSPFLVYPRPPVSLPGGLPFYPPSLMAPYPGIFPNAPNFLNSPLLFPPKLDDGDKRSESPKKERFTPPRIHPQHSKISPSAGEEATSLFRPSPARPLVHPTSESEDDQSKRRDNLGKSIEKKMEIETATNSTTEESTDQPLDLRVQTKKQDASTDDRKSRSPSPAPITVEEPPPPPVDPPRTTEEENVVPIPSMAVIDTKDVTSSPRLRTNLSTTDQAPTNTPPHMAYPRPIHPMFLEAMYRTPGSTFPAFPGAPPTAGGASAESRLLPPLPPFGPPRGLPFLGTLMNGLSGARPGGGFDLLARPPMGAFPGVKPFQDAIRSFMGKVTYGGEPGYHLPPHPAYLSGRLHDIHESKMETEYDEDEDSEEGVSPLEEADGLSPLETKDSPSPSQYDLKLRDKQELLNNNTAEPRTMVSRESTKNDERK
ncbi:histone-lysine N-methyltransferase PRDM16-like isoform X1 [Vespula squamosa]|uniref:Histone-lysine N-methyltransferase PRDM16-like isoform X1 n=1 Tax=Vespula squamosa TaxID=30214 RepID=A0ABD2BY90_VESSQ